MHETLVPVNLIGLPGSLRKASFSRATLIGLRDNLPENVRLEICDLQLPLYNEDDGRSDAPAQVRRFRDAIASSDGVVIVTPEYNHGVPGVLKNALLGIAPFRQVRADEQACARHIGLSCLYRRRARACTAQRNLTFHPGPRRGRTRGRDRQYQ